MYISHVISKDALLFFCYLFLKNGVNQHIVNHISSITRKYLHRISYLDEEMFGQNQSTRKRGNIYPPSFDRPIRDHIEPHDKPTSLQRRNQRN
jgi:hypothetical protein